MVEELAAIPSWRARRWAASPLRTYLEGWMAVAETEGVARTRGTRFQPPIARARKASEQKVSGGYA